MRRVRKAAAIAVPGLRFRERAQRAVLRRLRQADRGCANFYAGSRVTTTSHR